MGIFTGQAQTLMHVTSSDSRMTFELDSIGIIYFAPEGYFNTDSTETAATQQMKRQKKHDTPFNLKATSQNKVPYALEQDVKTNKLMLAGPNHFGSLNEVALSAEEEETGDATYKPYKKIVVLKNGRTYEALNSSTPYFFFYTQLDYGYYELQFLTPDNKLIRAGIPDIDKIIFALDEETAIGNIKDTEEMIVYNAETEKVYVANATTTASLKLFNIEGRCVRETMGNEMTLSDLPAGVYIVNYNGALNAKILKK